MRVVAFITHPPVIKKILDHLARRDGGVRRRGWPPAAARGGAA
jgi:hypothetical protein